MLQIVVLLCLVLIAGETSLAQISTAQTGEKEKALRTFKN
jgi:hypothetical protein